MKIISGIYWERGQRQVNQDSIALQQVMTRRGRVLMMAVSDGIGGLAEGENASGYITERLIENFYEQLIPLVARRKGKKMLKRSILRCLSIINQELKSYACDKGIRLGATLSVLLLWRKRYLIFHLGDSRVYLYRRRWRQKERLKLLTADHSDGGRGIYKCLGSFPFQYPDVHYGRIRGRSGFLLCTDGFYRRLDEAALQILEPGEIGSEEQIEKRLREMGAAALKKGERDNLSAVYSMIY